MKYIAFFDHIQLKDIAEFGGKNASLGEMIQTLQSQGIRVPFGFATTSDAYRHHVRANNLLPALEKVMAQLTDIEDLSTLQKVAAQLREIIVSAPFPKDFEHELTQAYEELSQRYSPTELCDVAVRSSATAEDLPGASFAGQQETYLHIQGIAQLQEACKKCMASLFTDRAIVYRRQQGIADFDVALSVGVQKMVRSDAACSGVIFTLDPETGFENALSITSSYGLGELVVQGRVNPDEFVVHKQLFEKGFKPIIKKYLGSKEQKLVHQARPISALEEQRYTYGQATLPAIAQDIKNPPLNLQLKDISLEEQQKFSLTDAEILELAQFALTIEKHYSKLHGRWCPMDIEWAKDSGDGKLYIVQARPETVHSKKKTGKGLVTYAFKQKPSQSSILISGQSVGDSIAVGRARIVKDVTRVVDFREGDILVADMTDPDWVPLMKKAAAIVTNRGGRTCHAAIVSRELGIPAVIGCDRATEVIQEGQAITVDCSQGSQGFVYDGAFEFTRTETDLGTLPTLPVDLLVNIANPDIAFQTAALPVDGVGLARLEFIISSIVKVHPMAVACSEKVTNKEEWQKVEQLAHGYPTVRDYFVDKLAQSIGMIAGAFYPRPVVVRLTDFKSNEYKDLLCGSYFEPQEENPMLGWRGAVRYRSTDYAPAFKLECEALKKAREEMGFTNIKLMVPFVRTVPEAQEVVEVLKKNGLKRGEHALELFMMVEIPANVILIDEFAQHFDGFSIGSNDLTQLTLGVDRDSGTLTRLFDERDPAVLKMLGMAVQGAKKSKTYIGICGQAPSDFPEIAKFLINEGINSLSLTPDSVIPFLMKYKA